MTVLLMVLMMPTAYAFQEHYNGNLNYPMVAVHQGVAVYVDKTSIVQKLYNPPSYTLAIAVFCAADGGKGPVENYHAVTFDYDYANTRMYLNDRESREWLNPLFDSGRPHSGAMRLGEAAFYIEYGIKFYGRYMWKSKDTGEYDSDLEDDFYEILDGKR